MSNKHFKRIIANNANDRGWLEHQLERQQLFLNHRKVGWESCDHDDNMMHCVVRGKDDHFVHLYDERVKLLEEALASLS